MVGGKFIATCAGIEDSINRTTRLWQMFGGGEPSQLLAQTVVTARRCGNAAACLLRHGKTIGGRLVPLGATMGGGHWGYLEQSPFTACLAGPLVGPQRNLRLVQLPSLDQHALTPLPPIEAHG
jgi:hypothetical protein